MKGPQATLFGTASAVGAIRITSARSPRGMLRGADRRLRQSRRDALVNAGNGTLAGRVAFAWKRRDGSVENLAPSQRDELYAQDQLGLRASLRWTPTDALAIDPIGTYDRQRYGGSPLSRQVLGKAQLGLDRDVYDANPMIIEADGPLASTGKPLFHGPVIASVLAGL